MKNVNNIQYHQSREQIPSAPGFVSYGVFTGLAPRCFPCGFFLRTSTHSFMLWPTTPFMFQQHRPKSLAAHPVLRVSSTLFLFCLAAAAHAAAATAASAAAARFAPAYGPDYDNGRYYGQQAAYNDIRHVYSSPFLTTPSPRYPRAHVRRPSLLIRRCRSR